VNRGAAVLLILGLVVLGVGLTGVGRGIGQAVGQAGALDDDAVATGRVGGAAVAFESAEPELSVYLDFHGGFGDSDTQDRIAASTTCTVSGRGFEKNFSGARQGVSATLGDYVSVGSFTLPGSAGRIACAGREPVLPFLVTPHSTGEIGKSVLLIIAGVAVAGLGGVAAVIGLLRLRRRRRQVPGGIPE
jgi:hypothetical protein